MKPKAAFRFIAGACPDYVTAPFLAPLQDTGTYVCMHMRLCVCMYPVSLHPRIITQHTTQAYTHPHIPPLISTGPPPTHVNTKTGVRLKPKHALQLLEAGAQNKEDLVAKIVDLVEHGVLDLSQDKTAMQVRVSLCMVLHVCQCVGW